MREKLRRFIPRLTIPRIISSLLAIGLGVNGLVQVHLQRDMSARVGQLKEHVTVAEQLSGRMNNGLTDLSSIRDSTVSMSRTLNRLEIVSANMDSGLRTLSTTVSGIDNAVQQISANTSVTDTELQSIVQHLNPVITLLRSMQATNKKMEVNLTKMSQDETKINGDLAAMDKKTSLLP